MDKKERYVSSEEKKTLKKDTKWARFGKSLLKGAAFIAGGIGATVAAVTFGVPEWILAGGLFIIARPIFGEVVDSFIALKTKDNETTKER